MIRIFPAFKAFLAVLFSKEKAQRVASALVTPTPGLPSPVAEKPTVTPPMIAKPAFVRSEALTLISTLQREARFLDLVQEPLDGYSDAQIGAAARDVLRDSAKTLSRIFDIVHLAEASEGTYLELPDPVSSARWRIIGPSPHGNRAKVVHAGWLAKRCEVPRWTGQETDAMVLSPAEVEA
jgi:hypothetical protein